MSFWPFGFPFNHPRRVPNNRHDTPSQCPTQKEKQPKNRFQWGTGNQKGVRDATEELGQRLGQSPAERGKGGKASSAASEIIGSGSSGDSVFSWFPDNPKTGTRFWIWIKGYQEGSNTFLKNDPGEVESYCGWTKSCTTQESLESANTNRQRCPMISKWCRISSIHSMEHPVNWGDPNLRSESPCVSPRRNRSQTQAQLRAGF